MISEPFEATEETIRDQSHHLSKSKALSNVTYGLVMHEEFSLSQEETLPGSGGVALQT